jgi:monofunctional biosynthetic peptidoglycan transglycosylase
LGVAVVLAAVAGLILVQMLTWPNVAALASEPPETTAFIDRYRERQRAAGANDAIIWRWVPASGLSPHLMRAVVAAEDLEFFSHDGFSTAEIKVAIQQAIEERRVPRGASTITQQLAKNLWLSPSRNPLRKLKEAVLTRQLEQHLGKERILEVYLNVVEFGPGVYGAESASQRYFGKPAAEVTQHEAAQLAATLPQPSRRNPGRPTPGFWRYVAEIEARMERATFLWRRVGGVPPLRLELDTADLVHPDSDAQLRQP